jgi:hypothetical protein
MKARGFELCGSGPIIYNFTNIVGHVCTYTVLRIT